MDLYYVMDEKLKQKQLNAWLKRQSTYQKKCRTGKVLKITGCMVLIFATLLFGVGTMQSGQSFWGLCTGLGVGAVFGCIPFFIGHSIIITAKKEYGAPYIQMEKEYLSISDEGILFGGHNTDSRYENSMDIYQIAEEEIRAIRFDQEDQMATIIGAGQLIAYDDILSKRVNYEKSKRRFYSNSPYSFILGFDKNEEVIKVLKDIADKKEAQYGQ